MHDTIHILKTLFGYKNFGRLLSIFVKSEHGKLLSVGHRRKSKALCSVRTN